jgi:hypothetical protein
MENGSIEHVTTRRMGTCVKHVPVPIFAFKKEAPGAPSIGVCIEVENIA